MGYGLEHFLSAEKLYYETKVLLNTLIYILSQNKNKPHVLIFNATILDL